MKPKPNSKDQSSKSKSSKSKPTTSTDKKQKFAPQTPDTNRVDLGKPTPNVTTSQTKRKN